MSAGLLDIERRGRGRCTGNKTVSDKVLWGSLGEKDVGFVEEEDAAPSVGEAEVAFESCFDFAGCGAKISCVVGVLI